MTGSREITHQFVEFVPDTLAEGVLYISIPYRTAVHLCCCGCRTEVATPLSRADWQLTYDGESVSLYPSIGNWSLPCRSHYWIRQDQVLWAGAWTSQEIAAARALDREAVQSRFTQLEPAVDAPVRESPSEAPPEQSSFWRSFTRLWL